MSVIVTDMEMPSGCWCCEFGAVWNDESSLCKRKPMESPIGNYEGRPLWCPLKEQEPKTGHWIFESQYCEAWSHTCSECGKRTTTAANTFANWCWNCGAKMTQGR